MFIGKMDTPAIPERVYALCKIVEKGPISNSDLKEKMEPAFLDQSTVYYSFYRKASEELKLISISDQMISLQVDKKVLISFESFRKYVNSILHEYSEGDFYTVTKAYYNWDNTVFKGAKNVSVMAKEMTEICERNIDAVGMRAWRFWVSFLGFGYLQDMFFIPNADVFLTDIIEISKLEKGKRYSFGDFIEKIKPYSQVVLNDENMRYLNYGFSCGLRTLHDQGKIKMEHILDNKDIWSLYPMKAHQLVSIVTNITINE